MGGFPGNARAPGLTRLPSKVEYAGRPLPTTRKTHMAFIQTDRKSAYVHLDVKVYGSKKKHLDSRVCGASALALDPASCPGMGPRGRMVQVGYANSLIVGLIGMYVFLTSAAYDQSGIIAPAHYGRPYYGVPSTTNRMARFAGAYYENTTRTAELPAQRSLRTICCC